MAIASASSAAAGNYSPKHLRAEAFLKFQALEEGYEPGLRMSIPRTDRRLKLGFQYPLRIGPAPMMMRVRARTKLRQLVRVELIF